MVTRVSVFVLLVFALSSCHGLGPEPQYWKDTPRNNTYYASAPFSYSVSGVKVTRSDYDARGFQTKASATLQANWLFNVGKILTIDLDPGDGTSVELQIQIQTIVPGTYYITRVPQQDSATAQVTDVYNTTYNQASGSVNIASIDTINNTVTGTFSFTASSRYASDTVRVLAGSFIDVPIYQGSFGQGYVTANAENEYFSSTTSDYGAAAYIYNRSNGLHIQAHATDQSGNERIIRLYVENPRLATYNLSPSGYAEEGTSYQSSTTTLTSGSGSLRITKFDTLTHRLSGTFNFSVQNYYGGTVRISNGVIQDVQWFVL